MSPPPPPPVVRSLYSLAAKTTHNPDVVRFPRGRGGVWWRRLKQNLDNADVSYAHVDGSSLYFSDPDGARLELISDPLGEMYGKPVF